MADEIITELWKVKDAIAKEYDCDVKALVAYLRGKRRENRNPPVDLRSVKRTAEGKKQQTVKPRVGEPSPESSGLSTE
ncbi:MAG: hypothetical protein HY788_22700 [Deltaproteobacteria bacterium]|nr:hypothetical protein [Deltaproteobacteria bacterium]